MPTFLAEGNIKKYILEHQKKYFIAKSSPPDLYISEKGEPHTSKLSNGSFELNINLDKNIIPEEELYIIMFPRFLVKNGKIRTAYDSNKNIDIDKELPIYLDYYVYPKKSEYSKYFISLLFKNTKIKFKYSFNQDVFFTINLSNGNFKFEIPKNIPDKFYDILFEDFINPYFTGKQTISSNINRLFLPKVRYRIGYKPDIHMPLPPMFSGTIYTEKTPCFKSAKYAYLDYLRPPTFELPFHCISNRIDIDLLIKRLVINGIIFISIKCIGEPYDLKTFIDKYKPPDSVLLVFFTNFTYFFFHVFNIFYYKNKYYLGASYNKIYHYQIFRSFENISEVSEFLRKIDTLTQKIEDNTLQELNLVLYCLNSYNNYLFEKFIITENIKYKWDFRML